MRTELRISGAELNTMSQMQLIGEYVMMYALEKLVRTKNSSISFYRKYYDEVVELTVNAQNTNSLLFFRAPILYDIQDRPIFNSRIKQCSLY